MRKPTRTLVSSVCSASGEMPYNWNWQRRWREVAEFLGSHKIVLMDVGARGDAPPELESLQDYVRRVGFEADETECARLNEHEQGVFFPNLVAGEVGPMTLNLYRDPAQSSVLTLNDRFRRLWVGEMPIESTFTSEAITIDRFLEDHSDLQPDFLKLDTQGTELDILCGAVRSLPAIGLVEVEVSFLEIYDGQPLFGDISRFMMEQGYELLYLNRCFVSRGQVYNGPSRGQITFGDALFGKREDAVTNLSAEQLTKYVILLCQFGHLDIAWQILQAHPEVAVMAPGLSSVFRKRANPVLRGALMQLDKLYALGLHARRYNQRGMDNDRAWPIR